MHGKFVCSQSASTFLLLYRLSIRKPLYNQQPVCQVIARVGVKSEVLLAPGKVRGTALRILHRSPTRYLLKLKSALVSPDTVTGFD